MSEEIWDLCGFDKSKGIGTALEEIKGGRIGRITLNENGKKALLCPRDHMNTNMPTVQSWTKQCYSSSGDSWYRFCISQERMKEESVFNRVANAITKKLRNRRR